MDPEVRNQLAGFLIWLKAIELINQKSHLTPEDLIEIKNFKTR